MEETDEGLTTIRSNHTELSGRVDKVVKSSIQLWYTKANTTAPAAPDGPGDLHLDLGQRLARRGPGIFR